MSSVMMPGKINFHLYVIFVTNKGEVSYESSSFITLDALKYRLIVLEDDYDYKILEWKMTISYEPNDGKGAITIRDQYF